MYFEPAAYHRSPIIKILLLKPQSKTVYISPSVQLSRMACRSSPCTTVLIKRINWRLYKTKLVVAQTLSGLYEQLVQIGWSTIDVQKKVMGALAQRQLSYATNIPYNRFTFVYQLACTHDKLQKDMHIRSMFQRTAQLT